MVLLQFSWRRGSKDSRGQGFKDLFSKDFISVFNMISISVRSFLNVPNSPLQFNLNPLPVISAFPVGKQNDKIRKAS
jgi:hypothetical protein